MKRILSLSVIALLLCTSVMAQVYTRPTAIRDKDFNSLPEESRKLVLSGLDLALSNVNNTVARAAIQRNIDRIAEKAEAIDVREEKGKSVVVLTKRAKLFGFIPALVENRFDVVNEKLIRRNRFIDVFFSEEKIEVEQ